MNRAAFLGLATAILAAPTLRYYEEALPSTLNPLWVAPIGQTGLADEVAGQLRAAGFDVVTASITSDDWSRKAVTGQMSDFDLLIGTWSFGQIETVSPLFHSRTRDGEGTLNIFDYANPDVDALLDAFDHAKTDTDARDAYAALHAALAEDRPYLFLWTTSARSYWRTAVRGPIVPYHYFTEFDQWRLDAEVPAVTPD